MASVQESPGLLLRALMEEGGGADHYFTMRTALLLLLVPLIAITSVAAGKNKDAAVKSCSNAINAHRG
ncbi:Hypothetical protein SMAX5B_000891 [Scophthalmus maximus]|uniref:Uncharacterized protein n=1 Tax=Scophthalmus maximus TaxID=52904 RepID=A0A2U9AW15_SCOMX|nr:Hypothetical protein SMAX5B_000891 [Scophthalmus maximus]